MLLAVLSVALAYGVWRWGAVLEMDRWTIALGLGVAAVVYYLGKRRYELAPP